MYAYTHVCSTRTHAEKSANRRIDRQTDRQTGGLVVAMWDLDELRADFSTILSRHRQAWQLEEGGKYHNAGAAEEGGGRDRHLPLDIETRQQDDTNPVFLERIIQVKCYAYVPLHLSLSLSRFLLGFPSASD